MAPAFIASTALWIWPNPVMMMTAVSACRDLESAEHLQAVHVRETEVKEDQVWAHLVGGLETFLAAADPVDFDLIPGQHARTECADVPFVVDDQDVVHIA